MQAWRWLAAMLAVWALVACGGGGGGDETPAPPAAPVLTAQPASAAVTSGNSATFSVAATGGGLGYQWQRSTDAGANWVAIAGATSASYVLAVVDASMNGQQFRALVSAGGTTVTSSAATLSVAAAAMAPSISVQPANQTATAGASASFSVTAAGTALTYQWQNSSDGGSTWVDIAGATSATLTLNALTVADNGRRLRVVVRNSVGTVTSSAATLGVAVAAAVPVITAQPSSSVSVVAGQTATVSVSATGSPAPSYQWQSSSDNGASFTDVAGATASSYTTPAALAADNGKRFRVRVYNAAGSAISSAATLTVTGSATGPTITAQPSGVTVPAAASATFSVTATGTPAPTYQWQISTNAGASFANINGATAASYATPATAVADSGNRYRVVVSNSVGSVNSSAATLTVLPAANPGSTLTAAVLANCPEASNASLGNFYQCMVGTLVGTSQSTGAACTFTVASNGVLTLQTGGTSYALGTYATTYTKVTRTGVLFINAMSTALQQMLISTGNPNATVASPFFTTGGNLFVSYTNLLAGGGASCGFVVGP